MTHADLAARIVYDTVKFFGLWHGQGIVDTAEMYPAAVRIVQAILDAEPQAQQLADQKPPRIWALQMPFRKNGSPVVGTFGARTEGVVIMRISDWTAMCNEVPALKTRQFEVGHYED